MAWNAACRSENKKMGKNHGYFAVENNNSTKIPVIKMHKAMMPGIVRRARSKCLKENCYPFNFSHKKDDMARGFFLIRGI